MTSARTVDHHRAAPSALRFMTRALTPSRGLPADGTFPAIPQVWTGMRMEARHLEVFREATGLQDGGGASVLYPHVLGFRLQMALLTHRAFPLSIWNALQVRNQLVLHRPLASGALFDLETRVDSHRLVEKGVEVDIGSRLCQGSECIWEGTVTYFYRGRFGHAPVEPSVSNSPDLARALEVNRFEMPRRGGLRFARLTGDYNGIHYWRWYARRLGFAASFLHPQRTAGICMSHLEGPRSESQRLDLWIKGPVFYGGGVTLRAEQNESGVCFGLLVAGDPRFAIRGHWRE
jgi:hypothetical protein